MRILAGLVGLLFVGIPLFVYLTGGKPPTNVNLFTCVFLGIAFLAYAFGGQKLLARVAPDLAQKGTTPTGKESPEIARRKKFHKKNIKPAQDTILDATFGKMVWNADCCTWECTPAVSLKGKSTAISLSLIVSEDSLDVTPTQAATWNRFTRESDALVAWAVEHVWGEAGEEWNRGVELADLLAKAKLTGGHMQADGTLDLDIDVGDTYGDHGILVSLGPDGQTRSAELYG